MLDIETFKTSLEIEFKKISTELEAIATKHPDTGDWVAIPVSGDLENADQNVEADVAEEWGVRRALMAQLEIRYRNITRALEKIENDTYGVCEISGEPIEEERLKANPAARTNLANIDREKELPL